MDSWQLQDAKNRFSELVEKARRNGPQLVTRRGKPAVVIVSAEEYQVAVSGAGTILDTLLTAPRLDDDFDVQRDKKPVRSIDL